MSVQSPAAERRQSTGIPRLDAALGGGLLPGTLTVVMGATGIGKTQLGLTYAHAGLAEDGHPGILFDMTTRGDDQNHTAYAARMFDWSLAAGRLADGFDPLSVWDESSPPAGYLHVFTRSGRRVTIGDMNPEDWQEFKADLMRRLDQTIAFFYGHFVRGVRRCVIDGVEPTDRDSDSFQFHLFDYVYHQILRKEHDWLARDLFRVHFRSQEQRVMQHAYDCRDIGSLLLYTSHETRLDDLIDRPIRSGDVLSNANTIILMGKTRDAAGRVGRALHVAKHRGSACAESIIPYTINERGLQLAD
jgi:KaiC/GvpD/RAD55 family RecA-like ATPase